jgi:hypothetical protein
MLKPRPVVEVPLAVSVNMANREVTIKTWLLFRIPFKDGRQGGFPVSCLLEAFRFAYHLSR